MSKKIVVKGLQAEFVMANMSASILREIVSRVTGVKATNIKLSGEISPNTSFTGNTCWSSQTTEHFYELSGFHPQKGIVSLNDYVGNWHNNTDGSQSGIDGVALKDIPNIDEYIFFIVYAHTKAYDEWYSEESTTVYKAPNFKSHWAAIEAEDITRWEQWLNK